MTGMVSFTEIRRHPFEVYMQVAGAAMRVRANALGSWKDSDLLRRLVATYARVFRFQVASLRSSNARYT